MVNKFKYEVNYYCNQMIKEIVKEINLAIDSAFLRMSKEDYLSFILLIGRADIIPDFKHISDTECVIDYQLDRHRDETREEFYLRYLNRNYHKEGFCYDGEDGIDALSIEMMIYTHLWESTYFLKSLVRIASILSGKGYVWNPDLECAKWTYMHQKIIEPLKDNGNALGLIVERGYSSDIRNAFAHSLYNINIESRTITIRPKTGIKTFSFEEFQKKFLYSVILMNKMQNALEANHDRACEMNGCLTKPFKTPDGVTVQIITEIIKRGDSTLHAFKMIRIDN